MHVQRPKETSKKPQPNNQKTSQLRRLIISVFYLKIKKNNQNSPKLLIKDKTLKNTSWAILKYEIHANAAPFPLHAEEQRLKIVCTWIEGNHFHSTCHAEVPEKTLFSQSWSVRARGFWEINASLRAAEPTPSRAGPKSRGPHQGAGILQFKNTGRKLSREVVSRNCVLGGKKPCSGMWWQLSSRHWKRLPRETVESPSLQIHRAQFDRALNALM